eukprot:787834_1
MTYYVLLPMIFIFKLLQIEANDVFYISNAGFGAVRKMSAYNPPWGINSVDVSPDSNSCSPYIDIDVGVGVDIEQNAYATAYCSGSSSPSVYEFVGGQDYWRLLGGSIERIAVCNKYNVYGINKNGLFYKRRVNDYNDYWDQKDGSNFIDVACGDRGSFLAIWGVTDISSNNLWKYNIQNNDWVQQNCPQKLVQISVGGVGGWLWGIADNDGNGYGPIYGTSDGAVTWYQVSAAINEAGYNNRWTYVEIGHVGRKYAIDTNEDLYWKTGSQQWQKVTIYAPFYPNKETSFVAFVERDHYGTYNGENYAAVDFLKINNNDNNMVIKNTNSDKFIYASIGVPISLIMLCLFNYWCCLRN